MLSRMAWASADKEVGADTTAGSSFGMISSVCMTGCVRWLSLPEEFTVLRLPSVGETMSPIGREMTIANLGRNSRELSSLFYERNMSRRRLMLWLTTALLPGAPSMAQSARPAAQVSVHLVLAVDVSGSVNEARFALQREGYAAAFRSQALLQAI